MKRIEAIIKPFKLEDVKEGLSDFGIVGMTVSDVQGYGRQKGHGELYRGAEYHVDLLPKVKLDIIIEEKNLEEVIDIILLKARTGTIGDGKIFISSVVKTIRIRTEEEDEDAL